MRPRVELALEVGEPIRGQLSSSGTGALSFYGWLELVAAIETVRHCPPAPYAQLTFPSG